MNRPPTAILVSILALIALAGGLVLGVATTGIDATTTPLVATVLGFVSLALLALLGMVRADNAAGDASTAAAATVAARDTAAEAATTAARVETKVDSLSNGKLHEAITKAIAEAPGPVMTEVAAQVAALHAAMLKGETPPPTPTT